MKLTLLLPSLALSLLTAAAAPRAAHACGPKTARLTVKHQPTRAERARDVIEAHFAAIGRGDAKAARALWEQKAKIRSIDAAGKVRTQKLGKALARWIDKRDGLSWTIGSVTEHGEGDIKVEVSVTWNGAVFDDVLWLREGDAGKLKLFAKKSSPHAAEPPAFSY